jgi:hypothetical protein
VYSPQARGVKNAVAKLVAVPLTKLLLFIATGKTGGSTSSSAAGSIGAARGEEGVLISRAAGIVSSIASRQQLLGEVRAPGSTVIFMLDAAGGALEIRVQSRARGRL